jgi:hypothetical protein
LTVRIELSSDSMVAGSQLAATLVVENTTDKPIDLTTGSCRSSWAITLRRASFVNEPVWTLECTSGPWIVTPGVHRWPSSILASYYHCSGSDQPPPGDVKCPPNSAPGTPPLPVGDYEAVLVTSAPGSLPDAPPVTVHVVDAHSRADLTTRIELPGATFVAGPTVTGTLVVDNNTGKPITLPTDAHGCQLLWRIALTNASIPPNTAFKAECYRPAKPLASGENRFPFTLVTTYITCTSVAGSGGCPPLPPGRYTAVLVSSTGVDPFPAPPPARVKLSAAP